MHIMHITRVVTRIDADTIKNRLVYYLNGIRVFIGYNARFVNIHANPCCKSYSEKIIELATTICINEHGMLTADIKDPDVYNFLILTKCISLNGRL